MSIDEVLGAEGALAAIIPGFQPRRSQIDMAHCVMAAMEQGETLLVEAGTGTGKTFAYLTPALLSGLRVIVSTGTRNLQDQLFYDDLPRIASALGRTPRVELLKGRANYVCRYRLERAQDSTQANLLHDLRLWTAGTQTGDLADFGRIEDDFALRLKVTSTRDNCLGAQCPDFDGCFVAQARRRAQDAEIVIVNHHLLCADLALKDEGFGEVLPQADALVVDEAHQLPEVLGQFFGFGVSSRQLRDLMADGRAGAAELGDMPDLERQFERVADALQLAERATKVSSDRIDRSAFLQDDQAAPALESLAQELQELAQALGDVAGRGPALATAWRRARTTAQRLQRWIDADDEVTVRWAERPGWGLKLEALPLELGPTLERVRSSLPAAWILTSATLAVGKSFEHFRQLLGVQDCTTEQFESPFDFAKQALLYHPSNLPEPGAPEYHDRLVKEILPLIDASDGGAFVLCTSLRAVERIGEALLAALSCRVLVQGRLSRTRLLREFRDDGHAVLVGTSSFWEGVDVRGQALRLVIIDRLPFASPDDPMLRARRAADDAAGRNTFKSHQLPQAVLALKQGAGRLIRDLEDRGVLVLADSRLTGRSYGRVFLTSLPPMPLTRDQAQTCAFLRALPRP